MSSPRLELMAAGGVAGWAAARTAAVDRLRSAEALAAPLLAFTPPVAAGALAGALLMRSRAASATAALAGAALAAVLAPRALPARQPAADGPVLRVLTGNLHLGGGAASRVVELVASTAADVLFLQELTHHAADRLSRAGLGTLLPHQQGEAAPGGRGSGIYARYPLSGGLAVPASTLAQPAARLDLPSGHQIQLVCVHCRPPRPLWSPSAVGVWRGDLAALPSPGEIPVILAGDFNATLDQAQFRGLLRRGYRDAASQAGNGLVPTWGPEPNGFPPLLTIDHVLIDPRLQVLDTAVHQLPGSDHRMLSAGLRLP